MSGLRTTKYCPIADALARHTDWIVMSQTGGQRETIDLVRKVVTIRRDLWLKDKEKCMAHVVAHLDLHLGLIGRHDQAVLCSEANTLADIRLDRP